MAMFKKDLVLVLLFMAGTLFVQGCSHGPSKPWLMPAKKAPETGAIFGSIEVEGKDHLLLRNVNIMRKGKVYAGMGRKALGEPAVVLGDNRFIAPNVPPGTYFIGGFDAGNTFHVYPPKAITYFEVKPGQLKFIGSFWYESKKGGMFTQETFSLKPAKTPSEMDMLRWLEEISDGTGWERSITQRIRQLGGRPRSAAERAKLTATTGK